VVPRWELLCWFGQPAASGTPALDKEVVHVRCAPVGNFLVVAPVLGRSAIKSQQSRRRASSLLLSPLQGKADCCARLPWFNDPGCAGGSERTRRRVRKASGVVDDAGGSYLEFY